jgi:hypothetical protein
MTGTPTTPEEQEFEAARQQASDDLAAAQEAAKQLAETVEAVAQLWSGQ